MRPPATVLLASAGGRENIADYDRRFTPFSQDVERGQGEDIRALPLFSGQGIKGKPTRQRKLPARTLKWPLTPARQNHLVDSLAIDLARRSACFLPCRLYLQIAQFEQTGASSRIL